MFASFNQLYQETNLRIEGLETHRRKRDVNTQLRFEHSVRIMLSDIWKAIYFIPPRECLIKNVVVTSLKAAIW